LKQLKVISVAGAEFDCLINAQRRDVADFMFNAHHIKMALQVVFQMVGMLIDQKLSTVS
jgi:hypothetical protein